LQLLQQQYDNLVERACRAQLHACTGVAAPRMTHHAINDQLLHRVRQNTIVCSEALQRF